MPWGRSLPLGLLSKNGTESGFTSWLAIQPNRHRGVAVLSNEADPLPRQVLGKTCRLWLLSSDPSRGLPSPQDYASKRSQQSGRNPSLQGLKCQYCGFLIAERLRRDIKPIELGH